MKSEGWKGGEALNPPGNNLQSNFWDIVGEKPTEDDWTAGKHVTLEMTKDGKVVSQRRAVIVAVDPTPDGGRTLTFRDLRFGEKFIDTGLVIGGEAP